MDMLARYDNELRIHMLIPMVFLNFEFIYEFVYELYKTEKKFSRNFASRTVRLYKLSQKLWNKFISFAQLNYFQPYAFC